MHISTRILRGTPLLLNFKTLHIVAYLSLQPCLPQGSSEQVRTRLANLSNWVYDFVVSSLSCLRKLCSYWNDVVVECNDLIVIVGKDDESFLEGLKNLD